MLTSFFNQSKPINFIIISFYMLVMFLSSIWLHVKSYDLVTIFTLISSFFCYLLTMVTVNRIVKKNEITSSNTLTIALFAFMTALFPYGLVNNRMIIANLFMILAVYHIAGLSYSRNHKTYIFNASLCISIAAIAYSWCIYTLVLVFVGIWYYDRKEYRNWLIPFVGLGVVATISLCFHLLVYDSWEVFDFVSLKYSIKNLNFEFSVQEIFRLGSFIFCSLFFLTIYLYRFKKRPTRLKPLLALFIWYYMITFLIALIFAEQKMNSIILAATPLAVIGTSYLELKQNKLISEINLWVLLILPIISFLF